METTYPAAVPRKPLRLWPGVILALLVVLLRYAVPVVMPSLGMWGFFGGLIAALLIFLWWLFLSRARWSERLGAIALIAIAVVVTYRVVDPSIAGGMMGLMLPIYAIPVLGVALVAGAAAGHRRSTGFRWASMIVAIVIACATFTLLRTDGIRGEGGSQITWRWTPTAEERLLAQASDEPKPVPPAPAPAEPPKAAVAPSTPGAGGIAAPPTIPEAARTEPAAPAPSDAPAEWPGFRGRDRDGVVHGVHIETDWSKSPPTEIWRRPIGPGWSSFAVRGDLFYTQEQRGDDEVVACYRVSTGQPVWRHRDPVRFYESNGGAGPRGTPTLSRDRVYSLGATGVLNALDATTGKVAWSRNAAADTKTETPGWGFSGSPLVVGDVVIVATSGKLAAYETATGKPRWYGPSRGGSYSSPHLVTIGGVPQVVMLSGAGTTSVNPADGAVLWQHDWSGGSIVQPALTADGDILVNAIAPTGGLGLKRLNVTHGSSGWTVQERWTSTGLKPYFNDFVLHKGHAYGFDGSILACIDLADGKRTWKGGRYGSGQLFLLPDQDLLVVISEEGELALVSASPDQFREVSRFPGVEGKTWNHPVLVRDVLLVRNGEEMAAFRLAVAGK
ncbi:MAG TPA: PQQ-binding-like beta-propeller repeat protein [Vicinamibacterales bacterium]